MRIPIFFSFARSGGTLVNQLLGVHPDCLVLSEVNPAASVVSIATQGSDWLGLIESDELDSFLALSYSQQVATLNERAKSKNKSLIIRDWVTVNYLCGAASSTIVPSSILEQSIYLTRCGYSMQPVVVTRKAQSVYRSLQRTFFHLSDLTTDAFSSAYLAYAQAVSSFPRISLEALQENPRETLILLLKKLELSTQHVETQINCFSGFVKCTGNNTLARPSNSSRLSQIAVVGNTLNDSVADADLDLFREADALLGYGA